jgi:hypothetical protein
MIEYCNLGIEFDSLMLFDSYIFIGIYSAPALGYPAST